jgi:histidine triad (HIT) family protein
MSVSATAAYDETNIFARILRGEVPCNKVLENEFALAFHDINPQAPVHVLVIPKAPYVSMVDFAASAPATIVAAFFQAVGSVAAMLNLAEPGYRLLVNVGHHGHQDVPHLHVHILGGRPLGPMLDPSFSAL